MGTIRGNHRVHGCNKIKCKRKKKVTIQTTQKSSTVSGAALVKIWMGKENDNGSNIYFSNNTKAKIKKQVKLDSIKKSKTKWSI